MTTNTATTQDTTSDAIERGKGIDTGLPQETEPYSQHSSLQSSESNQNPWVFDISLIETLKIELNNKVIGQSEAIDRILDHLISKAYRSQEELQNCVMSLWLNSPSGCGKNTILKILGEILNIPVKVLDLSAYSGVELTSLCGVSQGFTSSDNEAILEVLYNEILEENQRRGNTISNACIIAFDEVEKAQIRRDFSYQMLFNTFLSLMENSQVRMKNTGREIYLNNTIFFFLSNLDMDLTTDAKNMRKPIGFTGINQVEEDPEKQVLESVRKMCGVSFLNRLDDFIVLNSIKEKDLHDFALRTFKRTEAELNNYFMPTKRLYFNEFKDDILKNYNREFNFRGVIRYISKVSKKTLIQHYHKHRMLENPAHAHSLDFCVSSEPEQDFLKVFMNFSA